MLAWNSQKLEHDASIPWARFHFNLIYSTITSYITACAFVFYSVPWPIIHIHISHNQDCPDTWLNIWRFGQANNLGALEMIFFKLFSLGHDWPTLRVRAKTADNFRRNSFSFGNVALLVSYFRIFLWRLSASYSLALRAGDQLAWL